MKHVVTMFRMAIYSLSKGIEDWDMMTPEHPLP